MKTAMQEYVDWMKKIGMYGQAVKKASKLLEKEKEQIIEAWIDGHVNGYADGVNDYADEKSGKDYYTETFTHTPGRGEIIK